MASRVALHLLLAGLVVAGGGCRGTDSQSPPIHLNPNMDDQTRLDPQEDDPFFPDGRAMRLPVPGTVPATATLDAHRGLGRTGEAFAATLPAGMRLDRSLLERGRQRYDIYCMPCHDPAGTGAGSVVQRGMLQPPSFHEPRLRALPIGQIYDVITNGIRNMPPYASQVPVDDRWAIAAYVRALQVSRGASLDRVPDAIRQQHGWTEPAAAAVEGTGAAAPAPEAPR